MVDSFDLDPCARTPRRSFSGSRAAVLGHWTKYFLVSIAYSDPRRSVYALALLLTCIKIEAVIA